MKQGCKFVCHLHPLYFALSLKKIIIDFEGNSPSDHPFFSLKRQDYKKVVRLVDSVLVHVL